MKRRLTVFIVSILAFVMLIGNTAFSASAAVTYNSIGGTASFIKNLVVDEDTNIPDIEFTYTIKKGDHVAATSNNIEILEGIGAEIGSAKFTNADTANTIPGVPTDADPANPTAGKKYAQKSVTITFPDSSFTKPGVYRYDIKEITNTALHGVTYDGKAERYLDVFVVADENNVLTIDSFVLRETATNIGVDGAYVSDPDVKSAGYTNILTQYDFDFSKTISGNQGDKNKRFDFTLKITGANPGTYPIITNNETNNPTSITVAATGTEAGTATASFSLTDGSTVQVIGLNADAVCKVTENAEDYTATHSLDGSAAVAGSDSGDITLANDNHSVAFTNTRNGVIPTGIIMTIAPFSIGICVFGAVIIFIICRRKRRPY